jgi:CubicO group peptidase (beta-lactamase class C family)
MTWGKQVLAAALAASTIAMPFQTMAADNDKEAMAEAARFADIWLDSVQAYQHIPAISAGLVKGDRLIWSKGYGTIDRDGKVPAGPTTIYSICSISKLFTSVALMQLWEEGRVRLDAPITDYLPWAKFKPVSDDSLPVTLREMLSHSAGLPRESDFPYWMGSFDFPTTDQIRKRIATQTMLYPSGRWFQYSNLGLTLVGDTVAAVSGEDYADYARKNVIAPLGLKDTRTLMPMDLYGKRLAVAWSALNRDGKRDPVAPFAVRGVTPAAGYTSTVEDMARFAEWNFRLLRTGKPELLRASTLREMQRVQFVDPAWNVTWGLGFHVIHIGDKTYEGHDGGCPGYHSNLTMRPADETAVVLLDNAAEPTGSWAMAIFAILDKRSGFAFKNPAAAKGVRLADYEGRYSNQPWGAETDVVHWAGGLAMIDLPTDDPANAAKFLKPKGGDVFRQVRDDGSEADEVRFIRGKDGKVARFLKFNNYEARMSDLPPA